MGVSVADSTFKPFTVSVPATSANLGPGFDVLGIALDIVNTVRVEPSEQWEIMVVGEGSERIPTGDRNLMHRTITTAARRWGMQLPTAQLRCTHTVPLARGLGSSSAAIVAGLMIASHLGGQKGEDDMLAVAAEIEGHPDNVTPALLGGVQACTMADGRVLHVRVPLARPLGVALYVPDLPMPTREARQVVPRKLDLADAVYNLGRVALLVAGLSAGDYAMLGPGTQDMIHQPPRMRLFPSMAVLFHAALEAGALGVYLSGAGSTVAALAENTPAAVDKIARAMTDAAARDGITGHPLVSTVRDAGASIDEDG
jgi:homoserine kinase